MPKHDPKTTAPVKVPPGILPEGGDPAVFTTTEERKAILSKIEPPYRSKGAVRMVQPWRCTRCLHSGEFESWSTDDCRYIWDTIVRLHLEQSPDCHDRFLVITDWKVSPKVAENPEAPKVAEDPDEPPF